MELTIRELSPYLPYKLEVSPSGENNNPLLVIGLGGNYYVVKTNPHPILGGMPGNQNISFDSAKPLLRPLSQLTTTIEHNGEKFLPIERLQEIYTKRLRFDELGFYYQIDESVVRGPSHSEPFPFNQYEAYQYLFEWHFDIFGLIDKGLALPKH